MAKFRYEIFETDVTFPWPSYSNVRNVYTVNNAEFIITASRQKGKIYYIKEIKNKLKIAKADFGHYYNQINDCIKYYVNIYKFCGQNEVLIYTCFFSQKDISYNLDECTCEIELKDTSPYNCFDKNRSVQANILEAKELTPPYNVNFKYDNTDPNTRISIDFRLVISTVLAYTACDYYEIISDFFSWQFDGFGNPIILTAQPPTNYVNPSQPGYWIWISAKSDFRDPTASNPATICNLSFDDIERIMSEVFNVYWLIDGNRLRFEHYSWFNKNINYDTTIATNFPLNELKNKITFDPEDFPSQENWKWMESEMSGDFKGVPIIYSEYCSDKKPKDRGLSFATTDINYILNNPDKIANDGIVILDCVTGPGPYLYPYVVNGYITGTPQRNARLSWANLHYDLHRHNRPFKNGIMNNNPTAFLSPVYNKIQDNMLTKLCCTDDYKKEDSLVKTELGNGLIEEAEINFTKEVIKFKLKHE